MDKFKLHVVLNSVMKSHAIPLVRNVNHPLLCLIYKLNFIMGRYV